jgi:hypothetical protein
VEYVGAYAANTMRVTKMGTVWGRSRVLTIFSKAKWGVSSQRVSQPLGSGVFRGGTREFAMRLDELVQYLYVATKIIFFFIDIYVASKN